MVVSFQTKLLQDLYAIKLQSDVSHVILKPLIGWKEFIMTNSFPNEGNKTWWWATSEKSLIPQLKFWFHDLLIIYYTGISVFINLIALKKLDKRRFIMMM